MPKPEDSVARLKSLLGWNVVAFDADQESHQGLNGEIYFILRRGGEQALCERVLAPLHTAGLISEAVISQERTGLRTIAKTSAGSAPYVQATENGQLTLVHEFVVTSTAGDLEATIVCCRMAEKEPNMPRYQEMHSCLSKRSDISLNPEFVP